MFTVYVLLGLIIFGNNVANGSKVPHLRRLQTEIYLVCDENAVATCQNTFISDFASALSTPNCENFESVLQGYSHCVSASCQDLRQNCGEWNQLLDEEIAAAIQELRDNNLDTAATVLQSCNFDDFKCTPVPIWVIVVGSLVIVAMISCCITCCYKAHRNRQRATTRHVNQAAPIPPTVVIQPPSVKASSSTSGVPAQSLYTVVVPTKVNPGETFVVNINGQDKQVVCPHDLPASREIQVTESQVVVLA
uniref:Uncharacterized protein n=1 Tax=Aplanochytrium stocchinoi TaxID=215587 RepID=A0A7S3PFU0_9STRA|mmetsp:Transcript_14590/g.16972  ORF Transcript_14590/g.16972 Transcript_14590/m.16972 type:complete len:249 (-) Transcript_14590:135-881(-)